LFYAVLSIWLFFQSKAGIAMSAGGENPTFTLSSGINVERTRILRYGYFNSFWCNWHHHVCSNIWILQLYNAPLMMGFASVAAILIGGASVRRARIPHVIIGTFYFKVFW
jgi:simple sugar transport system permease protein